ncbi:MAG: TSUP family transporter [Gammaproteobacteria bacterium]|nr:TSUP family transporter [Gammaproteobacteria bacterium]
MLAIAGIAFGAGLIRGFTGFGGPAFMLAILTTFFSPIAVISKILVVDFFAGVYLFKQRFKQIDWPEVTKIVVPTLLFAPLGHWLLTELDPSLSKRIIATIISVSCILMLAGLRYKRKMNTMSLMVVGIISGIVFGGTYIALITVVAILLGPYDKEEGRTLIIAWSFFAMLVFALSSFYSGTTTTADILVSLPGAVTYMLGAWLGSLGFRQSSEKLFRRIAILTLLLLSVFNLVA